MAENTLGKHWYGSLGHSFSFSQIQRSQWSGGANAIPYPFDAVSLDYSGGLFYRNGTGGFARLRAIEAVIKNQAEKGPPFLLFISANTDAIDAGEVRHTIENIRTELARGGWNAQEVCDAYLAHRDDLVRLRIYVPFFVNQVASGARYHVHSEHVVAYRSNRAIQMLNYRFYLKPDQRTVAPQFPHERLSQIVNAPMILIENGKIRDESFGFEPFLRQYVPIIDRPAPAQIGDELTRGRISVPLPILANEGDLPPTGRA